MNEKRIELLIKLLNQELIESDKMFNNDKSQAYIIGWLQGTIKTTINELNEVIKEKIY
jgi:hypothetical protein